MMDRSIAKRYQNTTNGNGILNGGFGMYPDVPLGKPWTWLTQWRG